MTRHAHLTLLIPCYLIRNAPSLQKLMVIGVELSLISLDLNIREQLLKPIEIHSINTPAIYPFSQHRLIGQAYRP
jgi:hypothetical protein